jgi:MFS transporter, PPP family, 3-phenylpropionic acid transporter
VLAAGTAVRLAAGPAAGRLADRFDAPKLILALCSAAAALIALGYLPMRGLWPLFAVLATTLTSSSVSLTSTVR